MKKTLSVAILLYFLCFSLLPAQPLSLCSMLDIVCDEVAQTSVSCCDSKAPTDQSQQAPTCCCELLVYDYAEVDLAYEVKDVQDSLPQASVVSTRAYPHEGKRQKSLRMTRDVHPLDASERRAQLCVRLN